MVTDLLGDLANIAKHGHTILILETDICNTYMNIHLRSMMASSIDSWFIRYLYIFIHNNDIWLFYKI